MHDFTRTVHTGKTALAATNPVVLLDKSSPNLTCGGDSMTLVCRVQVSAPVGHYSVGLTMQWGLSLPPSRVFQVFAQTDVTFPINLQP
jgi:hypothetical protein